MTSTALKLRTPACLPARMHSLVLSFVRSPPRSLSIFLLSNGRRVVYDDHEVLVLGNDDELLLLGAEAEQLQLVLREERIS